MRVSGTTMDATYVTEWARRLGITALVERAREESGRAEKRSPDRRGRPEWGRRRS